MRPAVFLQIGALIFAAPAVAAEIDGMVCEVKGDTATVVTRNLVPAVGDKAFIFFAMPNTGHEVSIGNARVSKIGADSIEAAVEAKTGNVAKDQKVRISSANPTKRAGSQPTASGQPLSCPTAKPPADTTIAKADPAPPPSVSAQPPASTQPPVEGCFGNDRGAAGIRCEDHYHWAQKNQAQIASNLKTKVDQLMRCPTLDKDQLDSAFADISIVIPRYVTKKACFGTDPHVTVPEWQPHKDWAGKRTRQQVLDNLQWKIGAALKCLDSIGQINFFSDSSCAIAKAPLGLGGPATQTATAPKPPAAQPPAPAAPTQPVAGSAKGCVGFSGKWSTDHGDLFLNQTANRITGTYSWQSGPGQISGHVTDLVFDGEFVSNRRGKLRLTLSSDGNSFRATWTAADGGSGSFGGTCAGPPQTTIAGQGTAQTPPPSAAAQPTPAQPVQPPPPSAQPPAPSTQPVESCFGNDRGAAGIRCEDHYNWAQNNQAQIARNLKNKVGALMRCPEMSRKQQESAFADVSVVIARYVTKKACFGNDPYVTVTEWQAHKDWASKKSRQEILENLEWKVGAALKCMDSIGQINFFSDSSCAIAKAPLGLGGPATQTATAPQPPAAQPPAPAAPTQPVAGSAKGCVAFSGKWSTTHGDVFLNQNGDLITGTNPANNGKLTGRVTGPVLDGDWTQPGNRSGKIRFELVADGNTFKGTWTEGNNPDRKTWDGTCAGPPTTQLLAAIPSDTPSQSVPPQAQPAPPTQPPSATKPVQPQQPAPPSIAHTQPPPAASQPAPAQAKPSQPEPQKPAPATPGVAATTPTPSATGAKGCVGFRGKWNTSFGELALDQEENFVAGLYRNGSASISGQVSGGVLSGVWVQPDRHSGTGRLRFTLAADHTSFKGTWTEADGSGGGSWDGTCAGPPTGGLQAATPQAPQSKPQAPAPQTKPAPPAQSTATTPSARTPTTAGGGQYLGCFKDQGAAAGTEGRDLNGSISNSGSMTTALCLNECRAKNFPYAGTQYSSYCFCGNSYGKSGQANNCNMKCAGNPGETCGGAAANSVYATGVAAPATAAAKPGQVAAPAKPVQPKTGGIEVVAATYGSNCSKEKFGDKIAHGNVTAHLASACNGKESCDYRIDYTAIGDTAPFCKKNYVAEWRCPGESATKKSEAPPEAGLGSVVKLHCGAASAAAPAQPTQRPAPANGDTGKCPPGTIELLGVCSAPGPQPR